jgi:Zn-dependent protease/CBS domain-containing protein
MRPTFTLGRIFGIRISFNWSWVIIFAIIVWILGAPKKYGGVFVQTDPGLAQSTYWIMAVVAAFVFFISLLLHELSHSIVARRNGMEIEGITLWLLGGVSQFREMFKSPGSEFRIGLAGPAMSFFLGVIFVALALVTRFSTAVDGTLAWLGYINLLLFAFNLLPALPLDGGRLLHAIIWKKNGDFGRSTAVAAGVGRGFGYLMIGGGVFLLISGVGAVNGIWLALLGWFLLMAAGGEARFVEARESLRALHVRDLMTYDPATASADQTLGDFMDTLAGQARHSTYPVVSGEEAVGLLPFRAIAQHPRGEWDRRLVREAMLPREEVPVLDSEDDATHALDLLMGGQIHRGLVLHDEKLIGFISVSDIGRVLSQHRR